MDTDRSGDIDYNEFKNALAQTYFKQYSKTELMAAFKKFDTDGNGYITTKELDNILGRMGRRVNQKELEAMISSLDKDSDGKLSFDEFCKLFE